MQLPFYIFYLGPSHVVYQVGSKYLVTTAFIKQASNQMSLTPGNGISSKFPSVCMLYGCLVISLSYYKEPSVFDSDLHCHTYNYKRTWTFFLNYKEVCKK